MCFYSCGVYIRGAAVKKEVVDCNLVGFSLFSRLRAAHEEKQQPTSVFFSYGGPNRRICVIECRIYGKKSIFSVFRYRVILRDEAR